MKPAYDDRPFVSRSSTSIVMQNCIYLSQQGCQIK